MSDKKKSIDYTNRQFVSIRNEMIEYARKYYADSFRDFNEESFGMMMLELVALVGDKMSYYLDYQASETLLDSAIEFGNIERIARQHGYKNALSPSSQGILTFYVMVPADITATQPDEDLIPTLKKGTECVTADGSTFTLLHDVDFGGDNVETVVARVDQVTGEPTSFALRQYGRAISGEVSTEQYQIENFEQFRKLYLGLDRISEVIRVVDTEGNEYFEVDNLSQDIIFKRVANKGPDKNQVNNILKAVPAPYRFSIERDEQGVYLQFGNGKQNENLEYIDPSKISLDYFSKEYITNRTLDPSDFLGSDSLGLAPSNTTLSVTFRINNLDNVNASVGSISEVSRPILEFDNREQLSNSDVNFVSNSVEVSNDEKITGDISVENSDELRVRAKNHFATQKRAVTATDYQSFCYAMPSDFGAIKRANVVRDTSTIKNNINIYIVSEDSFGDLARATSTLKRNLKSWLNQYKMINDSVDILDATVVNFGIDFNIVVDDRYDKHDVLENALDELRLIMQDRVYDIGEPIRLSEIYKTLNDVDGVEDTVDVRIVKKSGTQYQNSGFNFEKNLSFDGRSIRGYDNIIFEVKSPEVDIRGTVA